MQPQCAVSHLTMLHCHVWAAVGGLKFVHLALVLSGVPLMGK
jgi:hypothetical protein